MELKTKFSVGDEVWLAVWDDSAGDVQYSVSRLKRKVREIRTSTRERDGKVETAVFYNMGIPRLGVVLERHLHNTRKEAQEACDRLNAGREDDDDS